MTGRAEGDDMIRYRMARLVDQGEGDLPTMTFLASTPGVKRDGATINQGKWNLDNYRANPVVLWVHDYASRPLGRAEVEPTDEGLKAVVTWNTDNAQAVAIAGDYTRGFLNAVSVGWQDLDAEGNPLAWDSKATPAAHELFDISAVPVPGDPQALIQRQQRALTTMARHMLDTIEEDASDEPDPARTAAEMASVFWPFGDESEASREEQYRALLPAYRRLRWAPPRFRSLDDLSGLDEDTWRGLFYADEADRVTYDWPADYDEGTTEPEPDWTGVLQALGDSTDV